MLCTKSSLDFSSFATTYHLLLNHYQKKKTVIIFKMSFTAHPHHPQRRRDHSFDGRRNRVNRQNFGVFQNAIRKQFDKGFYDRVIFCMLDLHWLPLGRVFVLILLPCFSLMSKWIKSRLGLSELGVFKW
jgi:hypothetical protein